MFQMNIDCLERILNKLSKKPTQEEMENIYNDVKGYNIVTSECLNFSYHGGTVCRVKLESALDFFIALEIDGCYEENLQKYNKEYKMAEAAVIKFGQQIEVKTLEGMQDIFYSFTNSKKYLQSGLHCSIARTTLNRCWHGIGPWRG